MIGRGLCIIFLKYRSFGVSSKDVSFRTASLLLPFLYPVDRDVENTIRQSLVTDNLRLHSGCHKHLATWCGSMPLGKGRDPCVSQKVANLWECARPGTWAYSQFPVDKFQLPYLSLSQSSSQHRCISVGAESWQHSFSSPHPDPQPTKLWKSSLALLPRIM